MDVRMLEGDALAVLATLESASVDACVTDPPYGLKFMGKAWDHGVPGVPYWSEVLRVLKPGGYLLAFGGTRTFHRLTCAIEDAGFEIRDTIGFLGLHGWVYGSGFPKSLNVNKDPRFCQCDAVQYNHDNASQDVRDMRPRLAAGNALSDGAEQDVFAGLRKGEDPTAEEETRHAERDVLGVRDAFPSASEPPGAGRDGDVFPVLQWAGEGAGAREALAQGAAKLDPGQPGRLSPEDERPEQSGLEGRRHVQAEQGQLHRTEVRPLPDGVHGDGPEGRVCDGASARNGEDARTLSDANRSRPPQGSQHEEQRPAEPGVVPEQRGAQTCGGCGKPRIPKGYGTALKPAWEPIILARKPLAGTVARNVLAHGTGALNIDECRIGSDTSRGDRYKGKAPGGGTGKFLIGNADGEPGVNKPWTVPAGRWPANVVLDEVAAAALDEQSGVSKGSATPRRRAPRTDTTQWRNGGARYNETAEYGDKGGASRFFYCAKASPSERGASNDWPTVKPIALMRWLVRLVTPPCGVVLDPFMGSGSTLLAADREGFDAIGIDQDSHAVEIARRRLAVLSEAV